jgi:subtilisin family serine protease
MRNKLFSMTVMVTTLTLVGCGGGGGGDSAGSGAASPQPESPGIITKNANARKLINAPINITSKNVIIAVADSGVNVDHKEFSETFTDSRSGAYTTQTDYQLGIDAEMNLERQYSDDHYPDALPRTPLSLSFNHGTIVGSLIYGSGVGLLSDGTILALDVAYNNLSYDGQNFNPVGAIIDNFAGMLAASNLAKIGHIDFINISSESATTYAKVDKLGPSQKDAFIALADSNIGLIASAGNSALNFTEIFVSNTPDCTDSETSQAAADNDFYAIRRCAALAGLRDNVEFIPYKDPELAKSLIIVGAVDNEGVLQEFSNRPGNDSLIQKRFIVAPGVNLEVAGVTTDGYAIVSGTSFAAPFVTAAAGALKSKFSGLSSQAALQALLDTANDKFDGYAPELHGVGILDIKKALEIDPRGYIT